LRCCLQEMINLVDIDTEEVFAEVLHSFEQKDKEMIANKFSKLRFLLPITDALILFEGGRNVFLMNLYVSKGYDWQQACEALYFDVSCEKKVAWSSLYSILYYAYCALICNDFFNRDALHGFYEIVDLFEQFEAVLGVAFISKVDQQLKWPQ